MGSGPDHAVALINCTRPLLLSSGLRCVTWQDWGLMSVEIWPLPLGSRYKMFLSPPAVISAFSCLARCCSPPPVRDRWSRKGTESYAFCSVHTGGSLKRDSICEPVSTTCGGARFSKPYTTRRFQRRGNGKEPLYFLPNLK